MTPKVIQILDGEPVSIEQARAHLEAQPYEDSDVDPIDDVMIAGRLAAAREHCENFLGLSLVSKVLEVALDSFPTVAADGSTAIDLPMGPVREIVSIFVPAEAEFNSDDVDSDTAADEPVWADGEVNTDVYALDNYSTPAKAKPVTSWPGITAGTNAVKVRYIAGYGDESDGAEPLPAVIKAAILLMLGHLHANREDTADVQIYSLPNGVEALLRPLRVRLGMA